MIAIIVKRARVRSIAVAILLCAIETALAQPRTRLALNENAFAFATQLIKEGRSVPDGKGAWSEHKPSAQEENEFIRLRGFGEYAKWHLGIDDSFAGNTKRRYKFPFGDFKKPSSMRAARGEKQSSPVRLHCDRKRGGTAGTCNRHAIKKVMCGSDFQSSVNRAVAEALAAASA